MFKPMLAGRIPEELDVRHLRYPLLASPKLDGIRALPQDSQLYSRKLKLIPNQFTQQVFSQHFLNGLDGELIVGSPHSKSCYRDTMSAVMSHDGQPHVRLYVFDFFDLQEDFETRLRRAKAIVTKAQLVMPSYEVRPGITVPCITILPQVRVTCPEELEGMEAIWLRKGYEGAILRDPRSPYKQGRSTFREGWMLKLKRFIDDDAVVIGFEELMHNDNEATINELGKTKRSHHKANMRAGNTLGSLKARDLKTGVEFSVCGFDDITKMEIWENQERYLGKYFKYKHFPVGAKDKPRHPIFLGWRDEIDL